MSLSSTPSWSEQVAALLEITALRRVFATLTSLQQRWERLNRACGTPVDAAPLPNYVWHIVESAEEAEGTGPQRRQRGALLTDKSVVFFSFCPAALWLTLDRGEELWHIPTASSLGSNQDIPGWNGSGCSPLCPPWVTPSAVIAHCAGTHAAVDYTRATALKLKKRRWRTEQAVTVDTITPLRAIRGVFVSVEPGIASGSAAPSSVAAPSRALSPISALQWRNTPRNSATRCAADHEHHKSARMIRSSPLPLHRRYEFVPRHAAAPTTNAGSAAASLVVAPCLLSPTSAPPAAAPSTPPAAPNASPPSPTPPGGNASSAPPGGGLPLRGPRLLSLFHQRAAAAGGDLTPTGSGSGARRSKWRSALEVHAPQLASRLPSPPPQPPQQTPQQPRRVQEKYDLRETHSLARELMRLDESIGRAVAIGSRTVSEGRARDREQREETTQLGGNTTAVGGSTSSVTMLSDRHHYRADNRYLPGRRTSGGPIKAPSSQAELFEMAGRDLDAAAAREKLRMVDSANTRHALHSHFLQPRVALTLVWERHGPRDLVIDHHSSSAADVKTKIASLEAELIGSLKNHAQDDRCYEDDKSQDDNPFYDAMTVPSLDYATATMFAYAVRAFAEQIETPRVSYTSGHERGSRRQPIHFR